MITFNFIILARTKRLLLHGLMKMQSASKLLISVNLKGFAVKSTSNTPIFSTHNSNLKNFSRPYAHENRAVLIKVS
jgi:hypothetical protein